MERLTLTKNEYGKPIILDMDIHFNISHSGEWVICAVDRSEIGVDIEGYRPIDVKIADRFFSEKEILFLRQIESEEERNKFFFKIWTLKESYIKSVGKGLYCPLNSFSCIPQEGSDKVLFDSSHESLPTKKFRVMDIDPRYSCAVCGAETILDIVRIVMSPENLLEEIEENPMA